MKKQEIKKARFIRPYFTEQEAKESVEKKKKFAFRQKDIKWISSVPLFLPYWLVQVEMDLRDPKTKGGVSKIYTTIINGTTNRGLLLKGDLNCDVKEQRGVFFDLEYTYKEIVETARLEALSNTKRMINPPPHRVLPGERIVYYPLAIVELEINGKTDFQVFDYYRGGLDKYMMRYINLKERLEDKKKAEAEALAGEQTQTIEENAASGQEEVS